MTSPATTRTPFGVDDAIAAAVGLPLERKVALLSGASTWRLHAVPEAGMRALTLSDGPIGVRGTGDEDAVGAQLPAPSGTAATWDERLQRRIAALIAGEAARKKVDVVLAPVVNLQRSPVGGRHFECLSEDPLLAGRLAAAYIASLQAHGVGATVKHFIGNETETERTEYVAEIDERTLREVYLAPFERVLAAGAWSVMAAYNAVDLDGVVAPATAHRPLLTGLLKHELGFDGVVVSDWLATKGTAEAALGGLDLVMPGPGGPWGPALVEAVRAGTVPEEVVDDKVARIVRLAHRVGALSGEPGVLPTYGASSSHAVAGPGPASVEVVSFLREAAARSTVVLRNEDALLPLDHGVVDRIALIGHNAVEPFTQGGGSAFVLAPHISAPIDALRSAFPGARIEVERGGATTRRAPGLTADAVRAGAHEPGMRFQLLDGDGRVRSEQVVTDVSDVWLPVLDDGAVTARILADFTPDARGVHTLEIAPVGAHRIVVAGREIGSSDTIVGPEVVLDSSYANPGVASAEVHVDDTGSGVRLEVDAQIVDAASYGRFVRVHFRHRRPGRTTDEEIEAAVAAAARADVAFVVVGTNSETESEGWDRPDLELPGRQNELVRRVAAANPRTVVVVNAGAPVLLPWIDDVPAVLWWWLPGQEAGSSLAAVLTGAVEPSGRLPWTLPARPGDVPVPNGIPVDGRVRYDEGLDVGHRAWDRRGLAPAREFGFGLGYAAWRYDGIELDAAPDGSVVAHVTVTNVSARDGREVVQAYLSVQDGADLRRPVRWLAGFAAADVAAGAAAVVEVPIEPRSFETWSTETGGWIRPAGEYTLHVGRSSRDLRVSAVVPPPADLQNPHSHQMQGGISR